MSQVPQASCHEKISDCGSVHLLYYCVCSIGTSGPGRLLDLQKRTVGKKWSALISKTNCFLRHNADFTKVKREMFRVGGCLEKAGARPLGNLQLQGERSGKCLLRLERMRRKLSG